MPFCRAFVKASSSEATTLRRVGFGGSCVNTVVGRRSARLPRSVEPIVVEVVRGAVVEARHRADAVAVSEGKLVAAAGDPNLMTYFRSAAKPIQALPLVRARPDLDEMEIAIASASHLARPEQLEAVRSLLAKAPAGEDQLECGTAGSGAGPTRIQHNCSGKHAGMLALCRARGWESSGYRLPDHPCQQTMLTEVANAAEVDPDSIPTGVDGCGVVTFALPLERMAHALSRLEDLDGGARVARAMRARPDLIRGPGSPDTELMCALPGWIAKGGAEAVLCAASPDGLGIALKVEDGSGRAVRSALGAFLGRLGVGSDELVALPLENSRGEIVGDIRAF
jgi:L-asparaginase II